MSELRRASEAELAERLARGRRREIFVWGAGAAGRAAATVLADHGVRSAGFIDRDPAKAGTGVDGRLVYLPDHVRSRRPRPRVLIASMYWREISVQLRGMGFQPGRDFEVFPNDGSFVGPFGGGAQLYAVWRHRWRDLKGLATGVPQAPSVRAIPVPAVAPQREFRKALARLPADDQWVVLFDDRIRRVTWTWSSGALPTKSTLAASAVYDWLPPRLRDRQRPFLLRALAHAAQLSGPVLCRARDVRSYLAQQRSAVVSMDAMRAWMSRRRPSEGSDYAGVCEVEAPPGARRKAPLRPRAPAAPGLVEFATHVVDAGLPVFAADEVASFLPQWVESSLEATSGIEYLRGSAPAMSGTVELTVLSHSRGNFFFREIRDFLARTWRCAGARVRLGDERSRPGLGNCRNVVIAPHEFFLLEGRNPLWDSSKDLVLVNTEQPQTRWFAGCLRHLLASSLVFDLNWQTSLLLRTLGINAHFLPLGSDERGAAGRPRRQLPAASAFLGMTAKERRLPDTAAWSERPIDILFVGTLSARRSAAFARAAGALSRYRCFLHLPPSQQPITTGSEDSLSARDMADLCRRAKIVLNIHRDDMPYCEWHRVMFQAMRHGALVVSEPMMPVPVFRAGREFLVADLASIPRLLARLLESAAGRLDAAHVAARGHAVLRRQFPADRIARHSLRLM